MQHITMTDLYQKFGKLGPKEVILDVRSPEEFRSGHIPGSKNIPHDQVKSHFEELKNFTQIYIHCQAGVRASKAAADLAQLGLNNLVCISTAGMGEWIAKGYPIER